MIVVGFSNTPDCERALAWAAHEAKRLDEELLVVSVMAHPRFVDAGGAVVLDPTDLEQAAADLAEEGARQARERGVEKVATRSALGTVAEQLVDAAQGARLLVIGSHGRSPLLSALLGSTSYAVCAHAPCPVVVVRTEAPKPDADRPIVVGVDGSERSLVAADFAARAAEATGAPLHCVVVWSNPAALLAASSYLDTTGLAMGDQLRDSARVTVEEIAESLRRQHPSVTITAEVLDGDPASTLAEASAGAGLLVTGSRGRGGLRGMMLGSVSHGVLHNAKCPVAIVR
ncbi:universal stress protein [Calidifontibacter sp. DB0510]|uniref:Universal stress protein n=1 Tax=Metallococcus carri TaxID=1656884 RepID=A0A967AYN1_9MICO|nr:universal stress protein [Metallococcus carri]NHN55103.1 universal stress protein [Metallococcus carri]NOP36180.1 universal stress protein [Calidifontibacter sp. DB2511S]